MHMGFWQSPGWEFGRGHRRGKLKRGILRYVLLKLLAEEPRHGYDLIRMLRRQRWSGGPGSVYPLLASLEAEGLIIGRDEGDRRTYEVTEKGRAHLEEHGGHFEGFFTDDEEEESPEREAREGLRESAGRLIQAVRQLGDDSKAETVARVRELLDQTRREIYTLLAQE